MREYLIADPHFGHHAIISYCNRPFGDVDEMDTTLIKRWNNTVAKGDRVWILGDYTCSRNLNYIKRLTAQLQGRKCLIMGNHDTLKVADYYEAGFEYVSKYPIVFNKHYILSHKPLFVNEVCPYYNIYGHVHDNPNYATKSSSGWCVCVERQDYRPVRFKV